MPKRYHRGLRTRSTRSVLMPVTSGWGERLGTVGSGDGPRLRFSLVRLGRHKSASALGSYSGFGLRGATATIFAAFLKRAGGTGFVVQSVCSSPYRTRATMTDDHTSAVVQRYLDELAGDAPAEPVVRALLDRAVRRLHQLCATLLHRGYPRLTRPPLNLRSDEMLGAVVERLLKALREARPATVRQFFALAGQHMRWELNDLARRLDSQPRAVEVLEALVPAPAGSDSGLTPECRRMIQAIDGLPGDEREAFDLVRIQGMTHPEAAEVLGVSVKTVKRRLDRGLRLLTERLGDLRPDATAPDPA